MFEVEIEVGNSVKSSGACALSVSNASRAVLEGIVEGMKGTKVAEGVGGRVKC